MWRFGGWITVEIAALPRLFELTRHALLIRAVGDSRLGFTYLPMANLANPNITCSSAAILPDLARSFSKATWMVRSHWNILKN